MNGSWQAHHQPTTPWTSQWRSFAGAGRANRAPDTISLTRIRRQLAFTLAETVVAMAFMAIVIPVAIQGISIASRAGVVARHKREAALLAEQLLSKTIITNQLPGEESDIYDDTSWMLEENEGEFEDLVNYRWRIWGEPWGEDYLFLDEETEITLHQVTAEVYFIAQGNEYSVSISTIAQEAEEEEEEGGGDQ